MSSKPILFLLIACFLSTSGYCQIEKVFRGTPCSYDTCISIELTNYRHIRQQFINRDSLITSLKQQVLLMDTREGYYDSLSYNFQEKITSFNNTISRKDSLILNLEGNIDNIVKQKTTDRSWFQRPATWISGAVGILIGVLVSN